MSCHCNCQLIDRECLVENTPLTYHIEEGELSHSIKEMQNLHMKDVFGDCYETICTDVNDNGLDGVSPNNALLLKEAQPAMAWFAYWEWLKLYGKSKAYHSGERRKNGENSDNVGDDDFNVKLGEAEARAEMYANLTKKYIRDNSDVFTCYDSRSDCEVDEADDLGPIEVV